METGKASVGNLAGAVRTDFVYGDLPDATAARAKKMVVDKLGYFISPSHLFRNVHAGAKDNADLNIALGDTLMKPMSYETKEATVA